MSECCASDAATRRIPINSDHDRATDAPCSFHGNDPPTTTTQEAQQERAREDHDNSDEESQALRDEWVQSPFDSGFTKRTWADEKIGLRLCCYSCCLGQARASLMFTSCICASLGAGRVVNMVVLRTRTRQTRDRHTKQLVERPQLICVMGPYWWVNVCITFPFLLLFTIWTGVKEIPGRNLAITVTWGLCNGIALLALSQVACRDPGILYRYREPPDDTWLWNDQAETWRPAHAKYDGDCAVVVDEYDHVCPWTGTAIGRKNMLAFRVFVCFTFVSLMYNVLLLAIL